MKLQLSKEESQRILLNYVNEKFMTDFNDVEISPYSTNAFAEFAFVAAVKTPEIANETL